eukprot:GFUD01033541.1.p1 GENE.GFUD01033541.1~~GFUD01033541.1.p1  ORF type:complete len:513 (+),score=81.63 GFUD01033541.1:247-1785(+)
MGKSSPETKYQQNGGKPKFVPQLLSAIAVSFGATVVGGWMSFTSVAIPKMMTRAGNISDTTNKYEEDPIHIDLHTGSWIASLFFIGNIIGCLIGGFLNQKLGAKRVFLLSAPIAAITWAMVALSHAIWVILLSRIISGILFGLFQANGKVYNAEIAHPDMRGSLGTIIGNMFALGSVFTYLTGYFVHSWRTIAWLQMIPVGLLGISVIFIPDSPYWLIERGREQDARRSLIILRGSSYDIEEEFGEIVNKKRIKDARGRSVLQTLCSRVFIIPFIRIGSLMMITQWAGINVITSYMVNIFMEAGSSIDPSLAPILVCTVQQILAMLSTGILRVSPRKPLFLFCATAIALSQASLGTYSYLTQGTSDAMTNTTVIVDRPQEQEYGWVPVMCVISVNAFRTIGFMAVIQLLLAESFPTEIRSYASGICGACTAINMFGATKLYPYFVDGLGFHGTFWMYGGVMLIEVVYGALSIPENKGQSLVKTEDKMISNVKDKEDTKDDQEGLTNLLGRSS